MKQILCVLLLFFAILLFPGIVRAKTAKDTGAFEYYTRDLGNNTCQIAKIIIKKDKGISELKIPDRIGGKTVVSIGAHMPYLKKIHIIK